MVRVIFKDPKAPKGIAVAIKKYIRETGGEAKQSECVEFCARMNGYRNHNELLTAMSAECSSADAHCSVAELSVRVSQFLEKIQETGFAREEAWDLICGGSAGAWLGIHRFMENPPNAAAAA